MSSPVVEEMLDRLRNLWASTPITVPAASASVLGGVKLKGDLGGTAESPTVPGLSGKAAAEHTHSMADVPGLPETLGGFDVALTEKADLVDGKVPASQLPGTAATTWDSVAGKPTVFPPDAHSHAWSSITDKPTEFPPATHSHSFAQVPGLEDALNDKAPALVEYIHPVWDIPAVTTVEAIAREGDLLTARTRGAVRGGDGPPPGDMPVGDGDVWIDLTTGKHYEYEEELS